MRREAEEAAFLLLDPKVQEVVLRRAVILDRYMRLSPPSAEAARLAAAELGTSPSNFYRLMGRYRTLGMVRGLAPYLRSGREVTSSRPGDWVDHVVERAIRSDREVRLATLVDLVAERGRAIGRIPPSAPAIQRRASRLRRAAAPRNVEPTTFGRSILVDQCAIDPYVAAEWDPPLDERYMGGIARPACTFVVDVDSRLILGVGIPPTRFDQRGFSGAIREADCFRAAPLIGSMRRVPLESVTWVLPQGLQRLADPFVRSAERRGLKVEAVVHGARRFGERLRKVIGDDIGPYRLLPRSTLWSVVRDRPADEPIRHPNVVGNVLALMVDEWNYEIVRRHEGAAPSAKERTRLDRRRRWTIVDDPSSGADLSLASMLLPGRPLDDFISDWGVHACRERFLAGQSELQKVSEGTHFWVPSVIPDGDEAADGCPGGVDAGHDRPPAPPS